MNTASENNNTSILQRLWNAIRMSFIASLLVTPARFPLEIPRESVIDRAWKDSVGYSVFDWLCNLLPRLLGALYRRFEGLFEGSAVFLWLGSLSDRLGLISGLFLALVLAIPQSYWNNLYSLIGALALACLFLVHSMRKKGGFRTELISPYLLAFAAFIAVAFIFSSDRSLSLRFFLFHVTCMLLVLIIVSSIKDRKSLYAFLIAMLAGFAIAALYGCYQGKTGVEIVRWQVDMEANAGMPGRVYSFFENANVFAEILVMLIPFVAIMVVNEAEILGKIIALIILGAALAALAMTYSRAGYLAIVVVFMVFLLFKNWKLIPLFLVVGILCLPLLPDTIFNRITTIVTGDSSINSRYVTYDSARKYLSDNWLTGTGLGTDIGQRVVNSASYYSNGFKYIHSHNTYVQIWIETGILGILSFLAALINWFKRSSAWIVDKDCPNDLKNIIMAGVAGIIGVLVFGLVDYIWFYPRVMVVFWAVIGVTIAAVKIASDEAYGEKGEDSLT
ncbi:MAG: hypothetical protein GX250_01500 [Clostridiales bacterium]|nr:hypothetical protein [Clostridiales bacterium]